MNTFAHPNYILSPIAFYIHDKPVILEAYFNDIYHLFLNRLVKLTYDTDISESDMTKLRSLLQELLKIKSLLQKGDLGNVGE